MHVGFPLRLFLPLPNCYVRVPIYLGRVMLSVTDTGYAFKGSSDTCSAALVFQWLVQCWLMFLGPMDTAEKKLMCLCR